VNAATEPAMVATASLSKPLRLAVEAMERLKSVVPAAYNIAYSPPPLVHALIKVYEMHAALL